MVDTGDLNSLLKVAYPDGVENLIPPTGKIMDRVKFVPAKAQTGKQYEVPVIVTNESGFTRSLDSQNAYALNSSKGMVLQSAIVQGTDLILSSDISYSLAARALSSKNSFETAMGLKMENMMESASKRLETNFLYGQTNIGQAAQQTTATTNPLAIVIDDAHWATGIWAGAEGSLVVFSVPATGAVVDSLAPFEIQRVDTLNKTIYVKVPTGGTGNLATLETAVEAAGGVAFHWQCDVYDNSSVIAYNEGPGLKKIFTNTSTLFNINAAAYNLWAGNTFDAQSGPLNFQKINRATSLAVQRGLSKKVDVFVNPDSWSDVMSNLAAQRVFDSSYNSKTGKNGVQEVEFYGQNGSLKLVPYNLVKEGDAFIFPSEKLMRVGSRDLSFRDPVSNSEQLFFQMPANAGAGLRVFTNQAIFCDAPAQCTYISGIVNSNNA